MATNGRRILILVALCVIGAVSLFFATKKRDPTPGAKGALVASATQAWALPDPAPNDAHSYKDAITKLAAERVALASR